MERRTRHSRPTPLLSVLPPDGTARAVAVVLPGGREAGYEPLRRSHAVTLRMRPFASAIRRRGHGIAIVSVRYRHRGWNAPNAHPVSDARLAILAAVERFGEVPVVLVGHSMGGRTALRAADDPHVVGVVALAPWLPGREPVSQLAGRGVALLHGGRDHTTSPTATAAYAVRAAEVAREVVSLRLAGTGHPMLGRATLWHRLTAELAVALASGTPILDLAVDARGVARTRPATVPS